MKKMKRLLAIILASLLILSSATAGASAYQAYKDDALTKYDFTDTAVLTTEQYASALLDYADKALAKTNLKDEVVGIKYDFTSINNALDSIYNIREGSAVKFLLPLLGDIEELDVSSIKDARRDEKKNGADIAVIKSVLEFLSVNKGLVAKAVKGGVGNKNGLNLGSILNGILKIDLDVSKIVREALWNMAYPDTDYSASNNVDDMLQVIIQNALAGVKEIPDSVKNLVDLNSTKYTYDFIEDLLQTAYNDIAVPMLNDQTMKWLGQEIDKDTTGTLAGLFNRDFRVSAYTVPAGSTLVAELNNIAGGIVNGLLKNYNGWVSGDNSKLTDNVVAVARYILKETGDYFFPDWQKHIATAEEIDAMSKEKLIAYIARSVINASVGYMYIPEDVTTVVGVAWEAVKQLMAQFLPERDYSGYPKTVQGILDMLADYVAYNVNPGIDLNAGDLKKALNYGDGMDKMLTTAVQWLKDPPQNYTGLLPTTAIDTSNGWKALDDIIFKLLDKSILPAKFANSGSETIIKDIVYSILNGLLVDQDLTCISDLFVKNESGAFATQTLKQSIVRLVTGILNAVLPGTITKTYGSLNEIVSNSELSLIVANLLESLNSNKGNLVPPIVNIVAQVMKLTDKAKFKEMEIAGSKRINNSSELDLTVHNGSQGINRGYTDKNNNFTQDKLPRYIIDSWSAVAYNYDGSKQKDLSVSGLTANEELNGGDNRSVKISGIDSNNTLVVFTVYYFALDEAGNKLTNDASVCRFYSYRLDGADVDNNTSGINTGSNKTSASVNDCPPKLLLFNQNNTNPLKTICAQSVTFKVPKGKGAHTGSNASANLGGLSSNLKSATSSASMDGGNAISGSNAYDSIDLWEETASIAKFEVGFDTTINWAATAKKGNKTDHYNGATRIICYNDYGLPELYNIEAGKNRARTDYDSSADAAWDAYITALNNAAIYTLLPGTIALYTNSEFLAGFEARQKALASAVETLETHLVSASVDSLKTAVEAVQGKDNAEGAVYWDDGYNYFGYDDFNSVTWNGWKEARNRALNLYNSTIAPKEPVAPEKPGDDATLIEKQKYDKAYAQWQTDHAAWETALAAWQMPTISAIDVAYAEQQVALWGPRLIKLAAVKTHLDAAIKMCTIDSADASKYDADRWEAYAKSFAYAQKVSTSFNASTTMRTQVREAMNNLIYNWKRLIANPVVSVTFTFTVNGVTHAVLTGNQGDSVDLSSIEAPAAPVGMHFVGWGNVPATFDADATFEAQFANNTDTKYTVNVYNMDTTGNYPATPDSTYQGAGETNSTADITADAVAAEGFSLDSAKSTLTGTIAADGSLVLKVYYSRNKYTLTVDGVASEVYYGAAVSVAEPSKEHYTFAGWEPELPDTMPANDVTVVSKWTEDGADYTAYDAAVAAAQAKKAETDYDKTYTAESRAALDAALAEKVSGKKYSEQNVVDAATKAINDAIAALDLMTYNATFYVDGAEYRVVPTKVGAQIVAPEAPSKTGYVFTGWDPAVGVMGTEDVSFNAQFSAGEVSYKVETYVMGLDGQYGAAETKTVPATTGAAVSVEPEAREGFTVADNSVLSGVVVADSSLVLKVYYSRNQYKLSVDGVESDVYYGAALNIAAPAAREGFTFTGWNVEVPANMPASDLTLVSQWSENDADYTAYKAAVAAAKAKQGEENYDKMYTAETRDALAGALAIDVAGKKYSEQSVVDAATKAINDAVAALEVMTYNAIFTVDGAQYEVVPTKVGEQIVAPKDPAKEGYVFKGWDKEVGKMGVEDITFAAQFEEASGIAYTVEVYTMDVNGNYGAAETKTLYGTTDAEVTADTTAAEGFTFDESAANVVSGTVAADGSLVLKVYFARNQYKLTVDGAESEVYYGAALDIATPAAREGYTFIGWNVDVPATMPASDLTLVSQWSENDADYTAYNAAVAAAQAKQAEDGYDKTYTAESRAALDAALAEKVSGKKYSEQSVVDAAAKAINDAVASLEVMTYNATFYVDGTEYRVVPTKVGEQIIAPENPTKEGFVFTGWDKEVGVMGTEDVSFNAQFSAGEVSYKVETYVMDVNGAYGAADVKVVPATTGAAVSVDPEAREGFTVAADSVLSGTVAADSSLVLKVYYSRNQYKLTVDGAESMVYYGAELNIAEPTKDHYTFAGWNVEVPATMPASDLTLVSQWTEEGADYTAYDAAVKAAQAKKAEADYDKTYTAESRAALDAALAIDVANKKYSEQADVDAATAAINDAVKALELMTYTANFYVNGQLYEAVTAKVGEQIIAPKDPSVDGYNFNGWDPAVGTMGTEDVRFDAILVASNSSIISVTPETPNYGGMHQYAVKVKGEPLKIKIVDANGNTRTFDRNTSMTSDANALGILKIEKTEDGEIWLINANLAEGKFTAYAKMAKEYWENDGYGFTVSFDQKPEPKIGDVTEVTYDTPNYGGKQDYRVKVTDKAGKIQFVYANGGTTTLTRLDPRVSIKSYDAQGNEVYANSTNLAYEIWTVNFNLPAGNYVVRAKYGRNTWSEGLAVNVVISAKPATAVSVTEVNASADSVAVTVNGTAKKVKITYASGATRTFNRDDANVSIASNGDGEIWTINVKLTEGDYTATAKYIDNGKQVWDTTDFAFTV